MWPMWLQTSKALAQHMVKTDICFYQASYLLLLNINPTRDKLVCVAKARSFLSALNLFSTTFVFFIFLSSTE